MKAKWFTAMVAGLVCLGTTALAGEITINSDASDPAPKKAWGEIIEAFKAETGVTVKLNTYDHESYKTSIRNWLASEAPDIVFWYAGERMNTFVRRGLIEDVSDVWDANNLHEGMASSRSSITFDDKQYAVPYTYYQWGIYYRKDIFDKYGLSAPKTWDEFLHVNKTLKENGITPITIGTKYLWTAAGWFDYLNIRVNGLPFHLDLMHGKIPYTDDRVKAVFSKWAELVEPGYFLENHTSYSWQEAQPFLFQGKAAMYLIGNFLVPNIPEDVADKMSFFQFPTIDPNVPSYEDAPTDVVAIPAKAKNKEDAKKFLKFLSRPDNIRKLNDTLDQLPTHKDSGVKDDRYLQAGMKMLSEAKGLAQFYDRDTTPEMAKAGMKKFQEFMAKPERVDKILASLEKTRKRIFK